MTDVSADVAVVGAGPAGLSAAVAAAKAGVRVVLLDAAAVAGGQIWRARRGVANAEVDRLLRAATRAGVQVLAGARVVMPLPLPLPGTGLLVDRPDGACRIAARRLVLATGARERLLPFPGWTLPGVFGAGGLQALAKGGWPVDGRRVVVAGDGPLLLAAAATLRADGARVVALAQEATRASLVRFAATLPRHPRQAWAALKLARTLAGVCVLAGTRIVAAEGDGRVERVRLATPDGERVIDCDALAASWGLVPQTELAEALGCALAPRFGARAVAVDDRQRTGVPEVFAAGECCGVAGVEAARAQGAIAGAAAARDLGARPAVDARLPGRLAREFRFADAVSATFPVPVDWHERLRDDTLVCRCEDVAWAALRDAPDLRAAKLSTRCGMGYCQGRVCHDALAVIAPRERLPARAPLVPVPLSTFLAAVPRRASGSSTDWPDEEPLP